MGQASSSKSPSLATALKNLDVGERYLTTLAGLDFTYRNVSELLDKINKLREEEGQDG